MLSDAQRHGDLLVNRAQSFLQYHCQDLRSFRGLSCIDVSSCNKLQLRKKLLLSNTQQCAGLQCSLKCGVDCQTGRCCAVMSYFLHLPRLLVSGHHACHWTKPTAQHVAELQFCCQSRVELVSGCCPMHVRGERGAKSVLCVYLFQDNLVFT